MNKKTLFVLILVSIFSLTILVPSARAGSKQKHRWEGVAIGIGAAILGGALVKQYNSPSHRKYTYVPGPRFKQHPRKDYYRKQPNKNNRRHGHWEMRKEWVPHTYKRVWNPAHYNRRGEWVPGGWIEVMDKPGYWTETRVWVAFR